MVAAVSKLRAPPMSKNEFTAEGKRKLKSVANDNDCMKFSKILRRMAYVFLGSWLDFRILYMSSTRTATAPSAPKTRIATAPL